MHCVIPSSRYFHVGKRQLNHVIVQSVLTEGYTRKIHENSKFRLELWRFYEAVHHEKCRFPVWFLVPIEMALSSCNRRSINIFRLIMCCIRITRIMLRSWKKTSSTVFWGSFSTFRIPTAISELGWLESESCSGRRISVKTVFLIFRSSYLTRISSLRWT